MKICDLGTANRTFPGGGDSSKFLASLQRSGDERVFSNGAHVRVERLKLATDAREVRINGGGLDVV